MNNKIKEAFEKRKEDPNKIYDVEDVEVVESAVEDTGPEYNIDTNELTNVPKP